MTREEAKNAAEVMLAYAEGKEIQLMVRSGGQRWKDFPEGEAPKFNFSSFDYRIKQEPTYRPFKDKVECWNEMLKHRPFGWINYGIRCLNIIGMDCKGIDISDDGSIEYINYKDCLQFLTFNDGTPFGIKEGQV